MNQAFAEMNFGGGRVITALLPISILSFQKTKVPINNQGNISCFLNLTHYGGKV